MRMQSEVGTVVHVAIDGAYAGGILISDIMKPTSKEAVSKLKKYGIKETVMLTGDIDRVAEKSCRRNRSQVGVQ